MDAEKLARLRELATPGPWYVRGRMLSRVPDSTGMGGTLHTNHIANFASREDCEYVHAVLAAHDAMAKRVEELEAKVEELEYVSGYAADLACIRKVLDEVDAPHDPEEGASLEPKRIRLLAEQRDALRAKVEELSILAESQKILITELEAELDDQNEQTDRAEKAERERDELRAVIARVRDVLSDCSLDHSIDAVSAIKAVLPREEG